MPKWTKEQQDAIDKEGSNIIVSAGAGSGKTAVLSERVLRKLKDGVNINELLILTFTKAAAFEMASRIRKKISNEPSLEKQLEYIDSSYITTFDSYALSVVKKYHYLLNIPKDVSIVDASVIYLKKGQIIDEIFSKMYEEEDPLFLNFIRTFCTKEDDNVKKYIVDINDKLDLKYDKEIYLEQYLDQFYQEDKITKDIELYTNLLKKKISNVRTYLEDISSFVDSQYLDKLYEVLDPLLKSNNYDEIKNAFPIKLPILPKNSEESAKTIKELLSTTLKEFSSLLTFQNTEDIKHSIYYTKDYVQVIIQIILQLDKQLNDFKRENNLYEFTDISKMAIHILKENEEVRQELKYYFKEIMVDEYQDTSDLQEEFISLIENNNVYMVGDIKQSIYRFRNANPYIFKNKYDNYSKDIGGYKIDLNKNFRSRREVLDDINLVFNLIMDDEIGGADYKESHQMVFGNDAYVLKGTTPQNNHLEILNYEYTKDSEFSKEEIEIFTIAKDIQNKVNSKYQVFDKDEGILRDITYNDFVILMDRASKFDLYKKIFGYLKIPLTKYTDTSITNESDTFLIKNIISLIISAYHKDNSTSFQYSFMSVARSFLFSYTDQEIFDALTNETYMDSSIMKIVLEIVEQYAILTPRELLEQIVDKFAIYEHLHLVGDITARMTRYEYLIDISSNMSNIGYQIIDFYNYLDKLITDGYDIKVSMSDHSGDSVKIMTIHKSKGLEYHICYYSGLYAKFNISDLKERFLYSNRYGIITPYFDEGIATTIYKYLLKEDYLKEEISEKIRLFYVALTRSKEKMIMVTSLQENNNNISEVISNYDREKYMSFLDILNSVYPVLKDYIVDVKLDELGLTKNYNLIQKTNYEKAIDKTDELLQFDMITIDNEIKEQEHYSKSIHAIINKETKEKLAFGTYLHHLLEVTNFKNPKLEKIDPKYRSKIEAFLNCGFDFKNAKIYKEYEFMQDNKHGIVDLILEYDDRLMIIDYKLKNIEDEAYYEQLKGYQAYFRNKTNKEVKIYLYSIMDSYVKEILL